MDHIKIKEKLDAYLDHELSSAESDEVAEHVKLCYICRDSISDWERTKRVFFNRSEEAPSEVFVYQVMEKIESKNAFDILRFLRWVFPTFAVMSAFLFISSIWLVDHSIAFEAAVLKEGSSLTIQEMATEAEDDWTGVEIL